MLDIGYHLSHGVEDKDQDHEAPAPLMLDEVERLYRLYSKLFEMIENLPEIKTAWDDTQKMKRFKEDLRTWRKRTQELSWEYLQPWISELEALYGD